MHKFIRYNIFGILRSKIDAVLIFFLLAATFGYFYNNPHWNENSRFGLVFALVQEGRLTIDSFHNAPGLKTGDKALYKGHYYSDKAVGPSILAATLYFPISHLTKLFNLSLKVIVIQRILTILLIGIPSAICGTLVYLICKFISKDILKSYIVTVAVTLGTMSFPYSTVFFSHQLAAALLFCAFFMMFRIKTRPYLFKASYLFLIGLLLGLALITEYTTLVIVLLLISYLLFLNRRFCKAASLLFFSAIGLLIPLAIQLLYNTLCFGSPFSIGSQHLANQFFNKSMAQGVMGIGYPSLKVLYYITLHPAMGLFWQSPVLLLVFIGAYFMYRAKEYREEAIIVIAILLLYLFINAGYFMWWGGWSFGPRHMIPALPFLCLPLIFVPRRFLFLMITLGLISILQMFIVAASAVRVPDVMMQNIGKLSYFEYSTIYSYCLERLLQEGVFSLNIGNNVFIMKRWMSCIPIILADFSITAIFFSVVKLKEVKR